MVHRKECMLQDSLQVQVGLGAQQDADNTVAKGRASTFTDTSSTVHTGSLCAS